MLGGVNDFSFPVTTAEMLPIGNERISLSAESERFVSEDKTIRMRVRQCEPVIISTN